MADIRPSDARDIVLAYCRDEEDVVEIFVRFYLEMGFDRVVLVDNGSVDGTVPIVRALIDEGLPVSLEIDERSGYERFLTEHHRRAGETWAPVRWLFFLDCDEFIFFPAGARAYLDRLDPAVNTLRLRARDMFPGSGRPCCWLLEERAEPEFDDTLKVVTTFHPETRVLSGKHVVERPNAMTLEPADLFIRHYMYRSPEQAARKERNRVRDQLAYSDDDLTAIASFGVPAARAWFAACCAAAEAGAWRRWFDPRTPSVELDDPGMRAWAGRFVRGLPGNDGR